MSDIIACPNPDCGREMDRAALAMCTNCGTDLWALPPRAPASQAPPTDSAAPPVPAEPAAPVSPEEPPAPPEASPAGPALLRLPGGAAVIVRPDGLPVALGRDPGFADAAAFAGFDNISRRHATVWFDGTTLAIKDNGSANGTWLDGRRLEPDVRTDVAPHQSLRLASDVTVTIDRGTR